MAFRHLRLLLRACVSNWRATMLAALLAVPAMAEEISWSVSDDGGTPRDTNRIERLGPREFRIRASFEEGGQSVLRHAVSTVDLLCRNAGPRPAKVIVHLAFDNIDRLRPDFAIAWHNWVAPRDRNVVFYTDGENGKATPRAWLRFTQLFPSLRGSDHRWRDETTPLRYNWEGRRPLSEANAHQYAMKKYGTRVWGWEMPWWNCSVAEARASGAAFGKAFLTTIEEIRRKASGADANRCFSSKLSSASAPTRVAAAADESAF
jgi:hypothetical protein